MRRVTGPPLPGGARHQERSCHRRYGNHDQRGRGRAGAGAEGDIGMSMLKEGRPTRPDISESAPGATVTGNRALMLEEALIFEIGSSEKTGVDFPPAPKGASRLGGLERNQSIGLRSEERRVGKECVSKCRSRLSQYNSKKNY